MSESVLLNQSTAPAALRVLDPGLHTTVQDLGRPGHRAWGVPVGGASDVDSHSLANAFVGNSPSAATLELTLRGGVFEAVHHSMALALVGAIMPAHIERPGAPSIALPGIGSFTLEPGDRLHLGFTRQGARTYLAVSGGWQTPVLLGSRSTETPLGRDDLLPAHSSRIATRFPAPGLLPSLPGPSVTLRLLSGPDLPHFDGLPDPETPYRVLPESNRMGLRLAGPPLRGHAQPDRLSTPVVPGALQVAGDQPILLGVACGTMGGYPVPACLASADLPLLAQCPPGTLLDFHMLSLPSAHALLQDQHTRMNSLRLRIRSAP